MSTITKTLSIVIIMAISMISCQKDNAEIKNEVEIAELKALQEEAFFEDVPTSENLTAESRGLCSTHAISIEYEDFFEYEFDLFLDGLGRVHFANNKSGTVRLITKLPIAVQPRKLRLGNIPNAKQNPKCPWMSKSGKITIKLFQATKDVNGLWVPVKGTNVVEYILGQEPPTEVTKFGTRVFCNVGEIGSWSFCTLTDN